ncbi:MAG TPA: cytochrome c [Phenylobacterium sp.]|uniref:c-type cytochrome n=1 Tax=Phenylobacterium sp. TaxID=1871053 RepID=UPI002BD9587D|nr:cytochrome c [Phenylobacterium sp.]HSV02472.1 cytochrome c [Phenylobacterium sp.]
MGMLARATVAAPLLAAALSLAGCNREARDLHPAPAAETGPKSVSVSDLYPGPYPAPTPSDPRAQVYDGNAFHIANGQRYYEWFNCSGCHFHGGGGIGPALMDEKWRYGGKIEQIYASIAQGRPNGMPSFKDRIPETQIWEIAAYVRSLSANADKLAVPSREDTMRGPPPLNNLDREPLKGDPAAAKAGGG